MVGEGAPTRDVVLYVNNQPSIDLVHNLVYHARSEQILAKYSFIRHRVHQEKETEIRKVDTSEIWADMLTKNAIVAVIRHNKKLLGTAWYSFVDNVFYPHSTLGGCVDLLILSVTTCVKYVFVTMKVG